MTSTERKAARRKRREEKRAINKQIRRGEFDDFDTVFSYEHLYQCYKWCRQGVGWKASTQKFVTNAPLEVYRIYKALHNGTWKSAGFYEFDLMERGKKRHIKSVVFAERVVQSCLVFYCLMPILTPTFIYDNGATLEGKGYTFAINRCEKDIKDHYKRFGEEGYVLTFDFSKYFDNISHDLIKEIARKDISDPRILSLIDYLIDCFGGDKGLGLGSPVSQIFALAAANRLDHYITEVLEIEQYARYNDDGYLIHCNKTYLKICLKDIRRICNKLGIIINEKKTRITKLSHGFRFLKCKFEITKTGRVMKKLSRKSITKARQRLKKYREFVNIGKLTFLDAYQCFQSWRAYASNFNAHNTIVNYERLYDILFLN